jgi:hypothetical protein
MNTDEHGPESMLAKIREKSVALFNRLLRPAIAVNVASTAQGASGNLCRPLSRT